MNTLKAFLKPIQTATTKEVVISERFVDEGTSKPVPFKIKKILQDENDALVRSCTTKTKDNGVIHENLNKVKYQQCLVKACVIEPDFSQADLCSAYGVVDPLLVPGKMLYMGEYKKLIQEIMDFNGFKGNEEIEEEAKN